MEYRFPKEIFCSQCDDITPHRPKMDAVKNGNLVCNKCDHENNIQKMNQPDQWVILKIDNGTPDEVLYKVFGAWMGGYLDGDSWRVNSGIVKIEEDDNYYSFYGYSGSCYKCQKGAYGTGNGYTTGVLNNLIKKAGESGLGTISIMDKDTDFKKLIK